jgi:hypothetical protein
MATWSGNVTMGVGTTYSMNFVNGNFILGASSWGTFYTTNPSGSWTKAAHPMYYPTGVAYGSGYYLFFGDASSGNASNAFYNTTIPSSSSGAIRIPGFILKNNIDAIFYGNSRYYYVGDGVHGYISPGTSVSFNNSTNSYALQGICMGLPSGTLNTIVACGSGGKIVTSSSTSFSSLSDVSSGTTNDLNSIVRRENIFVAVGNAGTIVTSNDISSGFSAVASGTTNDIHRVRVVNNIFVAVGYNCILSSTDGVSWTSADNIYGNPDITDVAYDSNSGRFLCTAWDGSSGMVFSVDDIAHYYITTYLTVLDTQLMTISMVDGCPIVAGSGAYAAMGERDQSDYYTFTELQTGVTNDINDMVWTDSFIGAIVCSGGVVGFNKFSGGAANLLTYKPIPLALANTPGIVQPDMSSITIDSKGIISAVGGGGGGSDSWVPSDQYINITYGASGDTYTAPADGWMHVEATTFNTNAYIIGRAIINTGMSAGVYAVGATTYSANKDLFLLFPVSNGCLFKMLNINLTVNVFRFVYAKGAI